MTASPGYDVMNPVPTRAAVRPVDRLWDLAALILVAGGVAFFLFARHAMDKLAEGTYRVPKGVLLVSRADLHLAQSRMAVWMVGMGVLVGIASAARHSLKRQAGR
jgi:hypothetical protein